MAKEKKKKTLSTIRKKVKKIKQERLGEYEQTVEKLKEVSTTSKTGKKAVAALGYRKPSTNLSHAEIKDFLIKSLWTETCVNLIADEVIKNKLISVPADPEVDAFLEYPSMKEPLLLIRRKYIKDMLRYGNGGVSIIYSGNKPSELQVQPGYAIRVTDKEPITYMFVDITKSGENIKLDKDDIPIELKLHEFMHFAIDMDSDMTLGRSPLDRGGVQLEIDSALYTNFNNLVAKGFQLPFFVGAEKATNKDMDEFLEFLNYAIGENAKAFGVNTKVAFSDIPHFSPTEIIDTMKWMGVAIANFHRVPPFMLNLISGVGSMNAREQKTRFLENVVVPILEYESYLYTIALVKKGFNKDNIVIKSPSIYNKLTFERARIARLLVPEGNILTANEVRKLFLDLPPLEEKEINEDE